MKAVTPGAAPAGDPDEGEVGTGSPARPVTQRLIVRYAKRGRMRFASHRDIARAVERGVRRAGLPIAYSAGFTPHPKISYAGAAPTGTASEAEYLELSLAGVCDCADVRDRLHAALPDGIDVIDVSEEQVPLGALQLEASRWEVFLPGIPAAAAVAATAEFLTLDSVEVERLTSKGLRRVDARAAVVTIEAVRSPSAVEDIGNATLHMVVRHVTPAVRPDDILAALRQVAPLEPSSPPIVTRLAQGPLGQEAAGAPAVAGNAAAAGDSATAQRVYQPDAQWRPGPLAEQPTGPGVAHDREPTTRHGADQPGTAGALRVSADDRFPRGAAFPAGEFAPGNPTGEHPDARKRAERNGAGQ